MINFLNQHLFNIQSGWMGVLALGTIFLVSYLAAKFGSPYQDN